MNRGDRNTRLKINCDGVPVIDKRMLKGNINSINLRKEIKSYSDKLDAYNKNKETILEDKRVFMIMDNGIVPSNDIGKPKLKKMRFGSEWF